MDGGESVVEEASLPLRPRLKPWYRVSAGGGGTVLRYGGSVLEFEGRAASRLLPHLLPLLDGTRTVDEIVSGLGEPIRPAVEHALRVLDGRNLLTDAAPAGLDPEPSRTAEFLAATDPAGRAAASIVETLGRARACVVGTSAVAELANGLLADAGLRRVQRLGWDEPAPGGALALVAPSGEEVPLVSGWNLRALAAGTTWLQVLPFDGMLAAVGPIFVPSESACHECYRLRRAANIAPVRDTAAGEYPGAPALDVVLAGLAATIALRRLALADGLSVGVLLAVEQALVCSRHVVYRVPRCPACSRAAALAAPVPWEGVAGRAA